MFSRNDYLFNILVDDDADLVILSVGGFVSDIERQEFADLLDNTLRNKKLISKRLILGRLESSEEFKEKKTKVVKKAEDIENLK